MRAIKFRQIIRTNEGKFKHWRYWGYLNPDNPIDFDPPLGAVEWDARESLQFTGLKDKNGVEIYEGDVVKYKYCWGFDSDDNYFNSENNIEQNGIVEFKAGRFYPLPELYDIGNGFYSWRLFDFEVIGNVFSNPELVKEEQ